MSYLNLNNEKWLDLIFENRNQNYGAYTMRKQSDSITIRSFFIGTFLLVSLLFLFGSNLFKSNSDFGTEVILGDDFLETTFMESIPFEEPIKELPEEIVLEIPVEASVSKINTTEFNTIEVVDATTISKDPPTVSDFIDSNPGATTTTGTTDGQIKVNESIGTSMTDDGSISTNQIFNSVEQSAIPLNGLDKFYKDFANKYNTPSIDEGITKLKVILSFVVEKDGSFTDIQILRDPGYGAGTEAVRVLKTMSKWKPAMQNGTYVRSRFSLPVTISVK